MSAFLKCYGVTGRSKILLEIPKIFHPPVADEFLKFP